MGRWWKRVLVVSMSALISMPALVSSAQEPAQEAGRIDLRQWRPEADGPLRLDGTWDFFWRRLIIPGQEVMEDERVPIEVPRFWHRTPVGSTPGDESTAGRGFGTYRLQVSLPDPTPPLALRFGNINTAAAVYAQGRLIWRAGEPAADPQKAEPGYRPGVALLPPLDTSELELLIQVSSFESSRGGLDDPVWIGLPDDLIPQRSRALTGHSLLVGGLLVMGLYHLFLFALRRRSRIAFYFGLVCFSAAGRMVCSDELLVLEAWPEMPWWIVVKGMYFFVFSLFGVFTLYLEALWPRAVPSTAYRTFIFTAGLGGSIVLLTPVSFFARGLVLVEAFVVVTLGALCWVFVGAVRRREEGRWVYGGGSAFVVASGFYDVAVSQGLLAGSLYMGPVGVFIFLFAQSAILAQRFARSLTTVEEQRGELQELVDHLERERRERERYEGLSLAASGLAHETKNPLGIIRGLAQRLATAPDTDPATKRRAGQILDQADRAAGRLGDFLSYARLPDPNLTAVRLGPLLRYAGDVLAPDLEAKAMPYKVDAGDAVVIADEEMLLQIVLNLLLNSVAASDRGDSLELSFEPGQDDRCGRLMVVDHGAGIAPELLDKVRKPYVTGRADGHGLGLALVERLAELHGWRLEIESRLGEGTRVGIHGLEITLDGSADDPADDPADGPPHSSP